MHPLGVAALARWGLLDRLTATGCPPIHTYTFDFGPFTISGSPGTAEFAGRVLPARTVLDKLLVDAAAEAGAEIREGFTVDEVLIEDGRVTGIKGHSKSGATVTERARLVIGADGRYSRRRRRGPARAVQRERPPLLAGYYTYWSGLPMDGRFETYIRPHRGFAAAPTHDGLTLTVGGWPYAEFEANKKDVEGNFLKMFDLVARVRGARARRDTARRRLPARPCRISSASRTVLAGRWSAMPATTRTRSRRRASTTPSATPSSAPTAFDQSFTGASFV